MNKRNNPGMRMGIAMVLCALALPACGPPTATPVDEVLSNLDQHLGKRVTIKAKFKSGARCKQKDGQWVTYCKDCQTCRGPLVVDSKMAGTSTAVDDWPMILGGTYEGKDIRCKGPLNKIDCHPFRLGKEYIVRGRIEKQRPPRLMVQKIWELD